MSTEESNTWTMGSCIAETLDRQILMQTDIPQWFGFCHIFPWGIPWDTSKTSDCCTNQYQKVLFLLCFSLEFHSLKLHLTKMVCQFSQCKWGSWECNVLLKCVSCGKTYRHMLIFKKVNYFSKLIYAETEHLKSSSDFFTWKRQIATTHFSFCLLPYETPA